MQPTGWRCITALSCGWKNDAWDPGSSHDTNQMNGAFTPEPENLELGNSCETGFYREQKQPRANLLRSFKEEEVRAFCCYSKTGRNCSTGKLRIWHHHSTFCPTSHTSLSSSLWFAKKISRKSQVIIHALLIHDFSDVTVVQIKRLSQSVSVLYPHLLGKCDITVWVRLLPYP